MVIKWSPLAVVMLHWPCHENFRWSRDDLWCGTGTHNANTIPWELFHSSLSITLPAKFNSFEAWILYCCLWRFFFSSFIHYICNLECSSSYLRVHYSINTTIKCLSIFFPLWIALDSETLFSSDSSVVTVLKGQRIERHWLMWWYSSALNGLMSTLSESSAAFSGSLCS